MSTVAPPAAKLNKSDLFAHITDTMSSAQFEPLLVVMPGYAGLPIGFSKVGFVREMLKAVVVYESPL